MTDAANVAVVAPVSLDRDVAALLPEAMRDAVFAVNMRGPVEAEWDQASIDFGALCLARELRKAGVLRSEGKGAAPSPEHELDLDVARLYFWLRRTSLLSNAVYPHPHHALSTHLAKAVNAVWARNPEFIGPRTRWATASVRSLDGLACDAWEPKGAAVDTELSLASILALRGFVLDPQVLEPGARNILMRELSQPRCLRLAVTAARYAALDLVATERPDAAPFICEMLAERHRLLSLVTAAMSPAAVADVDGAALPGPTGHAGPMDAKVRTATSARRLLLRMADNGFATEFSQIGWASGATAAPLDLDREPARSAIMAAVLRLVALAGAGDETTGFERALRDVGTVVGYPVDDAGDQALAAEFAGALGLELIEAAQTRWPFDGVGRIDLNPKTNNYLAGILANTCGDGSFFERVTDILVRVDLGPEDVACHWREQDTLARHGTGSPRATKPNRSGGPGAAYTFGDALRYSMPPGTVEAYEAKLRAARMERVIERATAIAAEEAAPPDEAAAPPGVRETRVEIEDAPIRPRRRRMGC